MVPAYLERLAAIPMTTSDKADRKNLPAADGPAQATGAPSTSRRPRDRAACSPTLLAATLGVDRVSADSHFFDDLGANSLLMARFAARVRKRTALPPLVDAGHLPAPHRRRAGATLADGRRQPTAGSLSTPTGADPEPGTLRYLGCADALQVLTLPRRCVPAGGRRLLASLGRGSPGGAVLDLRARGAPCRRSLRSLLSPCRCWPSGC